MNRLAYSADYGTNGGTALTRPSSAPSTSTSVHVSQTQYDTHGRAYEFTDPMGVVTMKSFNDLNMPTGTVEDYDSGSNGGAPLDTDTVKNRTTAITYNSYGQESTLVAENPKGSSVENQTTTYTYGITSPFHDNDLLASVMYPDTNSVAYTYDVMGRQATMADQNGNTHTYSYNSAGRFYMDAVTTLGTNIDGTVRRIQLAYDQLGRETDVASYSAASGGTELNDVAFTYGDGNGDWGQISEIQQNDAGAVGGGSPEIDYAYDDGVSGSAAKYLRKTSVTYPGPSTRRVVYYNYPSSGDGSVLSRLDNIAADSSGTTKYAQYTYLGASAIAQVQHPAVSNNLVLSYDPSSNGTFTNLDQFGQVTDQNWQVNSSTVDEYQYAYDYNGNRKYRANTQTTGRDEVYSYDALNRVKDRQSGTISGGAITGTPAWEQAFTLDELGNWSGYVSTQSGSTIQSQTRTHSNVNETTAITHVSGATTWVSPTYDDAGNMVSGPQPGNEATNLKFIYDAWNRLVQVTDNSNTIIVTYRYDGQNHRIQKLLGSNPSSPTSYYDYYYNESWQVLEERLGGSTNPYAQYVWDARYIDAPVVRFHDSNTDGTIDDTLYYCEDANMNVTALVDASGTVQERYTYDAYGEVHMFNGSWTSIGTTSAYDNQILFGGYRYDPESGLYHVRNRMYHPTLGRWMQRDLKIYIDGANLYQIIDSSPVNQLDPEGLAGFIFPRNNPIYDWWRDFYHNSGVKKQGKDPDKCRARDCPCLLESFWRNTLAAAVREVDGMFYGTIDQTHADQIADAQDKASRAAIRLEKECRPPKCPAPAPAPAPVRVPPIIVPLVIDHVLPPAPAASPTFWENVGSGAQRVGRGAKWAGGKFVDGTEAVGGKFVDGAEAVGGALETGANLIGGMLCITCWELEDQNTGMGPGRI